MTRSKLAYEVAKKVRRYLESMVCSRCREIARPVLLKYKPQKSHPIDTSTPERWKIGEGFMYLENMVLVRLDSSSRGTWQPEIWIMDPALGSLPPSRPGTTSEDRVQLGKAQLVSPPSSTVPAPDSTITTSTTLGGPRTEQTTHRSLPSQSAAAVDDLTRHDMSEITGAQSSSTTIDRLSSTTIDRL